ncbi:c-type cytochrome biogenesis protein CcmI [Mesobacterium sp. TK19101]|uniref:C-type cytochrome biogenesis protein CcmI n=1 Tax=Mesobacterium hydrothermale TaxID=3111907 RepID=A0ABU6HLP4_9RHOB|nr:c-type cytochrome biogenesis protein CcmI [Mesobacterium sp. TK19101]MEC3863373.1 c-type cytochrome biogenesis protein CcmI [Mesobacterium sp. TK19101]
MTTFWIITGLVALVVAATLALALMRGRRDTGPAEAFDLQVYRDQLKDVDRDMARGVIGEGDAERIRTEISRRILAADAKAKAAGDGGTQPQALGRTMAIVIALSVVGGSLWLYQRMGAPGYPDLGLKTRIAAADEARKTRPTQDEAEAQVPALANPDAPQEYRDLVARLREAVAARPDDVQGFVLLARSEAVLGNYKAAYEAQARLIQLKGDAATAKDLADLADMMVLAAGGYVSPEAETVLNQTMKKDPTNPVARFYGGLMMYQTGRPDTAFRIWQTLLDEGPADAPWVAAIRLQIEDAAMRAGIDYTLPPAGGMLPGPSQQDMANAADMTPAERQEMIQGMVDRLSDRLATEGGSPEEWARLLGALGILGDTDRAAAIWAEAQTVFAGRPELLEVVREGAVRAGVAEGAAAPAPAAPMLPGPTQQDVQNAQNMTPEERQEMITNMVAQLEERLMTEGGSPQEWARLLNTLTVLGDKARAQAAWDKAQDALSGNPGGLAVVQMAAQQAGLVE